MPLHYGWQSQQGKFSGSRHPCNPLTLGKGGTLVFNDTFSVVLSQDAVFEPSCTTVIEPETYDPSTIVDVREHFYASTSPQMYAIATATVLAYVLSIILFITPRTFFIGGRGGGFLGRHGMISGSYGSSSVIGVGGRPWLQKIAALTVAISLTIATADSFAVAKKQYEMGYMDSTALTNEVVNGLELRIIRVISSTFLWLAQVQTLIRLFPRHKEKVVIKWPNIAGWGEYIRWVGAAAASVVVWEWVERIEALEREERKDGILGREIFDGDEMLDVTPSEVPGTSHNNGNGGGPGRGSGWSRFGKLSHNPFRPRDRPRPRSPHIHEHKRRKTEVTPSDIELSLVDETAPPPAVASPVSRENTTSATSTLYCVRYHSVGTPLASNSDLTRTGQEERTGSVELTKQSTLPMAHNSIVTPVPSRKVGISWLNAVNPFKRRRGSPPQEVATAQAEEGMAATATLATGLSEERESRWKFPPALSMVASHLHRDWIGSSEKRDTEPPILPVTVIPVKSKREQTQRNSREDSNTPSSRFRWGESPGERKGIETPLPVMVIPARSRSAIAWSTPGLDEPGRPFFSSPTSSSPNPHPLTDRGTPSSILSSQPHGTNSRDPEENATHIDSRHIQHVMFEEDDEDEQDVISHRPRCRDDRDDRELHDNSTTPEGLSSSNPSQQPPEPPDPRASTGEAASPTQQQPSSDLDIR
ncbi:pH-response regulator protein palH/RIM21 [Nannizzia gypsea CBS 118893]|uniref:pH-response regulator protein palH/RIM21 n=1 Tax=Arthroderma gypseum (strain ATCC MYA-4604 / CBS 118893) TaxID=535722 RepID=E4V3X2_ARTGP|nr:pH-response regulator protein palH/RIM21 [Nannizzia gypsea CBS 118893]EFR04696.1 pH-response regulator protein palH/RIM21 [Nannizzia gypsea CBS 118893]